jgi:hypothetical protein
MERLHLSHRFHSDLDGGDCCCHDAWQYVASHTTRCDAGNVEVLLVALGFLRCSLALYSYFNLKEWVGCLQLF